MQAAIEILPSFYLKRQQQQPLGQTLLHRAFTVTGSCTNSKLMSPNSEHKTQPPPASSAP